MMMQNVPPPSSPPDTPQDVLHSASLGMRLWVLFFQFAKIAALVVGGGYAIIPVAEAEFVRKRKFFDEAELVDMMAIVQTVPGIIAGNAAIYIGFRAAGILGSLAALLGVITPSVIIITVIAIFLNQVNLDNRYIQGAFFGAQAAITGLITVTAIRMTRKVIKGAFEVILALTAFLGITVFAQSPVWLILGGAVCGMLWFLLRLRGLQNVQSPQVQAQTQTAKHEKTPPGATQL